MFKPFTIPKDILQQGIALMDDSLVTAIRAAAEGWDIVTW